MMHSPSRAAVLLEPSLMKRICSLILLSMLMVPSCCHTESRESPPETAPIPSPRMQPEYQRALEKHREKDHFYKKYGDPEDADEVISFGVG